MVCMIRMNAARTAGKNATFVACAKHVLAAISSKRYR